MRSISKLPKYQTDSHYILNSRWHDSSTEDCGRTCIFVICILVYTLSININGYLPFLVNMLDTILRGKIY